MKNKQSFGTILLLAALAGSASLTNAAVIEKANNLSALNTAGAWTNAVIPGVNDIAQWDSTVGALNTTNALGANLSVGGIRVINPGGAVLISAGNSLTNGISGIDLTAATVDVSFSNTVCIAPGALQKWNVAPGRTLSLLAIPNKPGLTANVTGVLEVEPTGTVRFGGVAVPLILDNQNDPWVTYGQNDWAALDGSGNVIAATYTPATTALTAGANNDIVGDLPGGTGSGIDCASIRFNDPGFRTLQVANSATSRTLTGRGILVTANSGGGIINGTLTSSFLRPNRVTTGVNTSFNIIQNSPADFTIAVNISNPNSQTTHVVKSGPGNLILSTPGYGGAGTDINGGTVTVSPGATLGAIGVVINSGRLIVNASNTTFVASVIANSGTTNTIKINTAGAQQFISAVAFNAGATHCEFAYGSGIAPGTTVAPLLVSNVTANGAIALDVYNNSLTTGTYPLIKYTNSLTGTGFGAFALGFLPPHILGYISNDVANTSIDLVVTNVNQPIHWAVGNGNWDVSSSLNWLDTLGNSTVYQQVITPYSSMGDSVLFNDSATGASPIAVALNIQVAPGSMTVSNSSKAYAFSGSGGIGGLGGLTKTGNSTLTLGTANSFSGGLFLNGGVVQFSSLTNLGAGALSFNGGTLQYASGTLDDISVKTVTLGAGGGTIDDGGNSITFLNAIGNGGPGGLTKAGSGTLILNDTNRYTGNTVVSNGTLALGGGAFISNSPSLIIRSGALLDAATYNGSLTLSTPARQVLSGAGTVSGAITVPVNTTIAPGIGSIGTLTIAGDLNMTGGTNVFEVSTTGTDLIISSGNLFFTSGTIQISALNTLTNGVYKLIQFSGVIASGTGTSGNLNLIGFAQPGKVATLSEGTGEIDLVIADGATDVVTWSGTGASWDLAGTADWLKGATPWAFTNGDAVTFDENGISSPTVQLQAVVLPGSITVSNETQTYTFADNTGTGAAKVSGPTKLVKKGPATLVIQTDDNNSGPTDIQNGTVQVGAGGIGDVGTGNVTNNGALVFYQGVNHQVTGVISGSGPVTQQGSAVLTLLQNNTYKGVTTISSGTLQAGTGGTTGSVGTNAVIDNGTYAINRSGTLTVPTNISGTGALRLQGTASETLSTVNPYQGNTYIDGGVVKITAPDLIPDANTVAGSTGWLVLDGGTTAAGTFDMNGFNETVNALSGLGSTVNGVITNSGTSTTTTNVLTVLETAATTYNGSIAENTAGSKLSLWLQGTVELRLNGASAFSGPTLVSAGATLGVGPGYVAGTGPTVLSNGSTFYMHANGSTAVFPGNALTIPDNSAVTLFTSAGGNGFGGTLVGGPTATNIVGGTGGVAVSISSLTKQLQSFAGTLVVPAGQGVRFSATALAINGGDNVSVDLEGTVNTRNGTGTAGAGVSLGALMGTGTLSGAGTPTATTSQYIIGAKGIDTVFSGTINDGSAGNTTIYKAGAGRLTLNGTISYTGQTTVSNGVLALIEPLSFDTSPVINLRSSTAVIDVSGRADGTLNLGNSVAQTLTGLGTIRGSLFEAASSSNSLTLGTLTVTNVATINGALTLQINRTNAPNAAELAANTFVNGGAIALNVSNVGATNFAAGDTFQLFSKAFPGTFTVTNLPVLAAPLYWTNNISINGSIAVGTTVTVNPNPTNITFSVSGNVLTLNWPADHTGWRLQVQTNGLSVGLNTNWTDVAGATNVNTTSFTINPASGSVFYRLVYP